MSYLNVRDNDMNSTMRSVLVYEQRCLWLDETLFFYAQNVFWRVCELKSAPSESGLFLSLTGQLSLVFLGPRNTIEILGYNFYYFTVVKIVP